MTNRRRWVALLAGALAFVALGYWTLGRAGRVSCGRVDPVFKAGPRPPGFTGMVWCVTPLPLVTMIDGLRREPVLPKHRSVPAPRPTRIEPAL
jgi:hypothetical protein